MIFTIRKGKHYSRPWRLGLWLRKTSYTWTVCFGDSCRYELGNDDQLDTNKLCGVGFLPHHHKNSARFGWVYDREIDRIILHAYCYVNGVRTTKPICSCQIGKEYHLMLNAGSFRYHLHAYERYSTTMLGMATIEYSHNRKFKFGLWPYFGGNRKAPHDIQIDLQRIG